MKRNFMYVIGAAMLVTSMSCNAQQAKKAASNVPQYEILNLPKVDLKSFKKDANGAYIIFDGTSLNGWRGYNKEKVPAKWSIEDGMLKFSKNPAGVTNPDGGDLIFAHDFKNFELEFEWKISNSGNSGVFVLAKEVKDQPIYISSPEYQLLDNDNHPDAKMGVDGNRKSGSLYDMIPAKPQNGNPAGQWNKAKIVVNKGKVTHYQNDVKVVEYSLWTSDWTTLLQASKFSEAKWPLAFELLNNVGGKTKSGVIGFQDHGDDVWLKNIKVKVL
ncbi:3-keto-disaccharide hydrolase [Sphingobacterium bambusae]|uniref:DUF1080 domain-containing protein n=1 Tax=Sphingobacterium bambusae TaxID=662858 RepID=A0ABW6BFG8_9SPHI|nr:DUF1080 domain-containing protein [Sphingobacterium bambusae]WPL50218.1 DUF1080 domain-containing protein [Sphingobacterium bambusae]